MPLPVHRALFGFLLLCGACTSSDPGDDDAADAAVECVWDAALMSCRVEGAGGCCGVASDSVFVMPDSECRATCPAGYVVPSACTTTCEPEPEPAPVPCGDDTCSPSEYCVEECFGFDAGTGEPPSSHCMPLPDGCESGDPCSCFCTFDDGAYCRSMYRPEDRLIQCRCG